MEWNWWIVSGIVLAVLFWVAFELLGVWKHDDHKVDTVSEMWWHIRNRNGVIRATMTVALGAVLMWTFYHLSFEGKQKLTQNKPPQTPEPEFWERDEEER